MLPCFHSEAADYFGSDVFNGSASGKQEAGRRFQELEGGGPRPVHPADQKAALGAQANLDDIVPAPASVAGAKRVGGPAPRR